MTGIKINEHEMTVKEYNGERVITFKDVDMVHERPEGTARDRFKKNSMRFILGEDYFKIPYSEFRVKYTPNSTGRGNPQWEVILLTESGYLMLVKSFTDDLAWQVQRKLVKSYFRVRELDAKPTVRLVVDIPSNADAQKAISGMREALAAIDVTLNLINEHNCESTYKHIRYTLERMTLELRRKMMDLVEVQLNLIQTNS